MITLEKARRFMTIRQLVLGDDGIKELAGTITQIDTDPEGETHIVVINGYGYDTLDVSEI